VKAVREEEVKLLVVGFVKQVSFKPVVKDKERDRTLFATQIGTKESYNRIVHMRGRLPERA